MLIFGHKYITSESLYHITNIEDIAHTPPSSTLYFAFSEKNLDIIEHANSNFITTALAVTNVKDLMFASSLQAKYIVVDKELAQTAQAIAQNYLFDAKILVHIDNEDELEDMALIGVDGVIFSNAIIKINS